MGGVLYTEKIAQEICEAVAASDESLATIFKRNAIKGWPTESGAYVWRMRHKAFREAFDVAKAIRAERWMHQIVAIADDDSRDQIEIGEGKFIPNSAAVARDRLRIDARERAAKRMDPTNWGDRRLQDETPKGFVALDDAIHLLD
jgi:hypothetical protein